MNHKVLTLAFLTAVSSSYAKPPNNMQNGVLLRRVSVRCGSNGTASSKRHNSQAPSCQEYTMYTDTTIYRIRSSQEKNPVLLPVGNLAQFHVERDKVILRVEELDDKDREYKLVSVTPRSNDGSGDTRTARMDHPH